MKIKVLNEAGYSEALLGLSLSYNQPLANMPDVARKLLPRGGSHIKFLESVTVWLDITAARYWWQQFDTYRVGVTKQSESTMHTLTNHLLAQADFEGEIATGIIVYLDRLVQDGNLLAVKRALPESFLQRRIVCTNYRVLRRILTQRAHHDLVEWSKFYLAIVAQVEYPEFLREGPK